jgi:four helix bundle protein
MNKENNSIIYNKSFQFSLNIIEIYKKLVSEKNEFVMSKQLLRCGTSIGANISESFNSQSIRDNISKLYIALKEASEAKYWIKLLITSDYINKESGNQLLNDINEIIKILSSIIRKNKNILIYNKQS